MRSGSAVLVGVLGVVIVISGARWSGQKCRPLVDSQAGDLRILEGICSLLTVEEVEAVMHAPVSFKQPGGDDNEPSCTYVPGEGAMYPLTLEIHRMGKRPAISGPVADLGDRVTFGPLDSTIDIVKDDGHISLQFGLSRGTREEKVELAKKLLSRL